MNKTLTALSLSLLIAPAVYAQDSINIIEISPAVNTTLTMGKTVPFEVKVHYQLDSAEHGSVSLVIQKGEHGDNKPLSNQTVKIDKGTGTLSFKEQLTIPASKTIAIFTPLIADGSTDTDTLDVKLYRVADD
jgi:hypothetical protein